MVKGVTMKRITVAVAVSSRGLQFMDTWKKQLVPYN
jgi:hypothetical protein